MKLAIRIFAFAVVVAGAAAASFPPPHTSTLHEPPVGDAATAGRLAADRAWVAHAITEDKPAGVGTKVLLRQVQISI